MEMKIKFAGDTYIKEANFPSGVTMDCATANINSCIVLNDPKPWYGYDVPINTANKPQTTSLLVNKGNNMNATICNNKNGFTVQYSIAHEYDECGYRCNKEANKDDGQYSFESFDNMIAWLKTKLVKA